jgi:hypothetical protein
LTRVTKSATDETVRAFLAGHDIDFPVAKEKAAGTLSAAFLVKVFPGAVLVVDGQVVWRGHPGKLHDGQLLEKLLGVYRPPTGAEEAAASVAFAEIDALVRAGDFASAAAKVPAFRQAHHATETYAAQKRTLNELSLVGMRVDPQWATQLEGWFQGEGTVDLHRGSTLVVFWEEWDPQSRQQLPKLVELLRRHEANGLRALGLTRVTKSATDEAVRGYLGGQDIDFPVAKENSRQALSTAFLVNAVPGAALVVDGLVVWRGHPGKLHDGQLLEKLLGVDRPPTGAE